MGVHFQVAEVVGEVEVAEAAEVAEEVDENHNINHNRSFGFGGVWA